MALGFSPISANPLAGASAPVSALFGAALTSSSTVTPDLRTVSYLAATLLSRTVLYFTNTASLNALSTVTANLGTGSYLGSSFSGLTSVSGTFRTQSNFAASLISSSSFTNTSFYLGSTGSIIPPVHFPPLPHVTEEDKDGTIWKNWNFRLDNKVRNPGQIAWNQLSFKGSNLTNIATRLHDDLQGVQGGASGDMYHLTLQQHDKVDVDEILLWLSF